MIDTSTHAKNGSQRKQMHYSPNLISVINNAIESRKVATIEHESFEKGVTLRDIEPMALVYKDRRRALVGWCRLRNDFRSFRLDRINTIKLSHDFFIPKENFKVEDFQDSYADHEGDDYYED